MYVFALDELYVGDAILTQLYQGIQAIGRRDITPRAH